MTRIVGGLVCLAVLAFGAGESQGRIVVNEILADPAGDWDGDSSYSYRDDEWIEVYNTGSSTVDISSYWLGDADSTLLFNLSGTLAAGAHRIVYGSDAVDWQRANGHSAVGFRLNNSGDTVRLWEVEAGSLHLATASGAVLIDSYTYSSHEAEDDRSSGRVPDGGEEWQMFDGLNPYGGSQEPQGNGCLPTPGTHNGCPTPVEGRSWGSVKSLYR